MKQDATIRITCDNPKCDAAVTIELYNLGNNVWDERYLKRDLEDQEWYVNGADHFCCCCIDPALLTDKVHPFYEYLNAND